MSNFGIKVTYGTITFRFIYNYTELLFLYFKEAVKKFIFTTFILCVNNAAQ